MFDSILTSTVFFCTSNSECVVFKPFFGVESMNFFKMWPLLLLMATGMLEAETRALYTNVDSNLRYEKMSSEQSIPLSEREVQLINHVKDSVTSAEQHVSRLTPAILALDGMSSTKNRCLLNNILTLPSANYLEIGCWKGSTLVSALYGNETTINTASVIDNWSEFGGPYQEFLNNCKRYLGNFPLLIYSHDCFDLDPRTFITLPINVYFYDGGHTAIEQEKAFTFYNDVFDDLFICIVDDWNWEHARTGTLAAFEKLNYQVLYEVYLPANCNGDRENWWHGFYVAVIRK